MTGGNITHDTRKSSLEFISLRPAGVNKLRDQGEPFPSILGIISQSSNQGIPSKKKKKEERKHELEQHKRVQA